MDVLHKAIKIIAYFSNHLKTISFFKKNFLTVFYSPNFCPNGPNYTHYKNERFDALYKQCRTERNDSLRKSIIHEMNDVLMQDAPVIPLYYDQVSHFVRSNVSGLQTNPVNMLDLRPVRKN